ncbi:MAG: prolipoprotein diacylglyceryl transferase, partial [Parvibaculum sp.]
AMFWFARKRGFSALTMMDLVSAAAPIGLFFGRLANFINAELWGRVTDAPWAVIFPGAGPFPRHPSQLYEAALEGIVLFLVLRLLTHRFGMLQRPGVVMGGFIAGYGIARTIVEFFREPDAQIGFLYGGWMTMGMVLSVPMALIGAAIIWKFARAGTSKPKRK